MYCQPNSIRKQAFRDNWTYLVRTGRNYTLEGIETWLSNTNEKNWAFGQYIQVQISWKACTFISERSVGSPYMGYYLITLERFLGLWAVQYRETFSFSYLHTQQGTLLQWPKFQFWVMNVLKHFYKKFVAKVSKDDWGACHQNHSQFCPQCS